MKDLTFNECCRQILADPKNSGQIAYAKSYAYAGLKMPEHSEMARTQCRYILSNLPYWRGETAKAVRAHLKKCSKSNWVKE